MSSPNRATLDAMIAEATVDCYNDSECVTGFYTMLDEHLDMPFQAVVLGVDVTVASIDQSEAEQIVTVCARGRSRQRRCRRRVDALEPLRPVGELTAPPDQLDEANLAVLAGITWLVENRADILSPLTDPSHRWEWHVALAEQLVRRACHPDRSDPKRAFALVAAYDQLVRAGETVPRPAGTF